jgi:hypothetical protein
MLDITLINVYFIIGDKMMEFSLLNDEQKHKVLETIKAKLSSLKKTQEWLRLQSNVSYKKSSFSRMLNGKQDWEEQDFDAVLRVLDLDLDDVLQANNDQFVLITPETLSDLFSLIAKIKETEDAKFVLNQIVSRLGQQQAVEIATVLQVLYLPDNDGV